MDGGSVTKDFDRKTKQFEVSEDALQTNPNYSTGGTLYRYNCGNCSTAYEMRRRGFDVEANPMKGMYVIDWLNMFSNATPIKLTKATSKQLKEDLKTKLTAMGDGARGSLFVQWKGRSMGHFFSWEVNNGEVLYIDAQCGKVGAEVEAYFDYIKPTKTVCVRWDNLTPSDAVKNACKNKRG